MVLLVVRGNDKKGIRVVGPEGLVPSRGSSGVCAAMFITAHIAQIVWPTSWHIGDEGLEMASPTRAHARQGDPL